MYGKVDKRAAAAKKTVFRVKLRIDYEDEINLLTNDIIQFNFATKTLLLQPDLVWKKGKENGTFSMFTVDLFMPSSGSFLYFGQNLMNEGIKFF